MKFKARTNEKKQLEVRWDLVNVYLSKWPPGTFLDVEITRRQKKKSDPLRKYYWSAVLPPLLDALGYERDEDELVHRQLKILYFRVKPDKRGIYRNVPSVFSDDSELPVYDKMLFLNWVIRKAAENGVYIEDPSST